MKIIQLNKELSDKDAYLLSRIGIKIDGLTLKCIDDRNFYFKINYLGLSNLKCYVHCYDDNTPVASISLNNDTWFSSQEVHVNEEEVEAALVRMTNQKELKQKVVDYPCFEKRKKMIKKECYLFLFKIPFCELRYDEKNLVFQNGFKYEGSEQYHPLSENEKNIISLIKSQQRRINDIENIDPNLVNGNQVLSIIQHHYGSLNSILNGDHKLTSGLSVEQINGYYSIAVNGFAPADFHSLIDPHVLLIETVKEFCKLPEHEQVDGLLKIKAIIQDKSLDNFQKVVQLVELANWKKSDYEFTSFLHQKIRNRSPEVEAFYQNLAAVNINDKEAVASFVNR